MGKKLVHIVPVMGQVEVALGHLSPLTAIMPRASNRALQFTNNPLATGVLQGDVQPKVSQAMLE